MDFQQQNIFFLTNNICLFIVVDIRQVNVSGDALVSGIFIKNIISGSSADLCGLLKVGDRILGEH